MNWFFDAIIFGFLALDLIFLVLVVREGKKFLSDSARGTVFILALLAWGIIFYGSFVEPRRIVVTEQNVDLDSAPMNTMVAAVISDLHAGPYKGKAFFQQMVEHLVEIQPDVIFLAGDYVYDDGSQVTELEPLKEISEVYPMYAVLGNHDYDLRTSVSLTDIERANHIDDVLRSYGIHVLRNQGVLLPNKRVWLAGVSDVWSHRTRIGSALYDRPVPNLPTILLAHNPDTVFFMQPSQYIDLVIAGHTHGGQIRLPLIGPVPNIPDDLGREYDKGLFDWKGVPLFITSGIGESGPRARLFNPPEIAVLELHY